MLAGVDDEFFGPVAKVGKEGPANGSRLDELRPGTDNGSYFVFWHFGDYPAANNGKNSLPRTLASSGH
jgi:hypothetical protein